MSCCAGDILSQSVLAEISDQSPDQTKDDELWAFGKNLEGGKRQYLFTSPDISCGSCISILEKELGAIEGVEKVRVNLTLKRISILLSEPDLSPTALITKMQQLGFEPTPIDIDENISDSDKLKSSKLLRALAVAGFGAMNIMLLSVSTWSGANGSAKTLFHLISALIAIPTVLYAGQIFFISAIKALRHRHLNMDVPISLAVILALSMSVYEALTHGDVVYFDASVSLLFFLLIGRYLDHMMRQKARNAVGALARKNVRGAYLLKPDGQTEYIPIDEVKPGMMLQILPGDKIPVDGTVIKGTSDVDLSLANGESLPIQIAKGALLQAGIHNLSGALEIETEKTADQSFLAEVGRMLEAAENGRGSYVRIADRMAQIYAPAVHFLALVGFIGWMILTGGDWHISVYIAISILIITCPCALGLAVPVVHVIGAGRLFDQGILMKDGSALERLSEIDMAVFDKTGTLTNNELNVQNIELASDHHAPMMKALAQCSNHPASKAIARYFNGERPVLAQDVSEHPGFGMEAKINGKRVRLGAIDWVKSFTQETSSGKTAGDIAFAIEGETCSTLSITGALRQDAHATLNELKARNIPIEILSGDNAHAVANLAQKLKIDTYKSQAKPADKIAHILDLKNKGHHVLMVGDGINDAPALAEGHASMAPASASDVGRSAADFIFTRNNLSSVIFAHDIAKKSDRLIKQNFGLALFYNAIAVPLAFMGYVTPLFAAIAMSASSIVVILNSMRLTTFHKDTTTPDITLPKKTTEKIEVPT